MEPAVFVSSRLTVDISGFVAPAVRIPTSFGAVERFVTIEKIRYTVRNIDLPID
jgi:hypothetical protein